MSIIAPTILDLMEYANAAAAQAAFVTSASLVDVCSGGTPSAISEYSGFPATSAFDNIITTCWSSSGGAGQPWWIKYDLGAGVTKIVNQYTVRARDSYEYFCCKDWKLQGSNNDSSWTDLDTQSGQIFTAGQQRSYTLSAPNTVGYRYHRLLITATNSADVYCQIAEIEFMGVSLQVYSESTIKQEGSYSLKGIAAITDSNGKTLTRTVSPTINLTDKAIITFYIRASRTGSNIKIGIHDSGGTTTEITPVIAAADTWQTVVWDISAVSNANKDAIDQIIITVVNADAANTFYIDNMFGDVIQSYLIHRGRDRMRTAGYSLG